MHKSNVVRTASDRSPDPLWRSIRAEALEAVSREPVLAAFLHATVLHQESLEDAVSHRVAARLNSRDVDDVSIRTAFGEMQRANTEWREAVRADLQAYFERDPVCDRFTIPILYNKGFHAIQCHRLAHWLWTTGHREFASYLQSRSSEVFQTDIHPAARMGRGIFLDHATGLVIGETAVVEDDVSILQDVTLGGTGKVGGDRHPKVRRGVLLGAGSKVLGNIVIGEGSKVAAGSVVLASVAAHTTVAGIPARVVGGAGKAAPSFTMDQMLTNEA